MNFDCKNLTVRDGNLFVGDVQISKLETLPEGYSLRDPQALLDALISDQRPEVCGERSDYEGDVMIDLAFGQECVATQRGNFTQVTISIAGTPVGYALMQTVEEDGKYEEDTEKFAKIVAPAFGVELGKQWG